MVRVGPVRSGRPGPMREGPLRPSGRRLGPASGGAAAHHLRMRRWNGWGDESITDELPTGGAAAIERVVGPAMPPRDATLADVLARVPASRLPRHRLVASDAEARIRHARGQSFSDWVALRTGRLDVVPDGVAFPNDAGEVRELLGMGGRGRRARGAVWRRHERRRGRHADGRRCAVADGVARPPGRAAHTRRGEPARDVWRRDGRA